MLLYFSIFTTAFICIETNLVKVQQHFFSMIDTCILIPTAASTFSIG